MEAGVGRSGPCRGSATCGPASVDGQNMARHHSGFFRAEPHDSVRLFLSADRATNGLVLDEIVDHHLTYFSTGFVIRFRRGHPRRRSEEHTSELQSLMRSSYAAFCLKKKKIS